MSDKATPNLLLTAVVVVVEELEVAIVIEEELLEALEVP